MHPECRSPTVPDVINMLDGAALRHVIELEKPDYIVPEVEAIATPELLKLEQEGFHVIPTAKAAFLTMNPRRNPASGRAKKLGLPTLPLQIRRVVMKSSPPP